MSTEAEKPVATSHLRPVPNEPPDLVEEDRTALPQAPESEQAVLGGLMAFSASGIRDLRLRASDFYVPRHGMVFEAIMRQVDGGLPTDAAAVLSVLTDDGSLQRAGGSAYLHTLLEVGVLPASMAWHAEVIREKAAARNAIATGIRIQQLGRQAHLTAADRAELAQKLTADLDPQGIAAPSVWLDVLSDTITQIEEAADNPTGLLGISTGLPDLDRMLGGLRNGMLYVVAGRPGMGKTVLLQNFARSAAHRHQMPTGLWSLEMNKHELAMRMLSAQLSIPLKRLQQGALTDQEWTRIAEVMGEAGDPLHVDDTPGQSLAQISAAARSMKRRGQLSLALIDYVQLIITAGRSQSREQEVAGISRGLKLLAKELDVPVVIAAQLNRGNEARTNKRPQLSDLRESGALEQDADAVILVHRDDYYDRHERVGEADLIVPKNRHGETGTVTVVSQLHLSRFMSSEMHL